MNDGRTIVQSLGQIVNLGGRKISLLIKQFLMNYKQ
jgi:hypothetical protein